MQLHWCPVSSASLVVIPSWLSAWLASWSHFQNTQAPVDARQAHEWGLSKSRLLSLWQWYKHELLVYCYICQMPMINEIWNCACSYKTLLANLVTFIIQYTTYFVASYSYSTIVFSTLFSLTFQRVVKLISSSSKMVATPSSLKLIKYAC